MKLKVLDNCVFPSLLYSSETWGNIEQFKKRLIGIELKLLKALLGVKLGTPNHHIYIEFSSHLYHIFFEN